MNSHSNSVKPELPFLAHLRAKLNAIIKAEGGKLAAAKRLGVDYRTFHRWGRGEDFPGKRCQPVIDARYRVALEMNRLGITQKSVDGY